jgi:membrane-associated phospholipid phosphatase
MSYRNLIFLPVAMAALFLLAVYVDLPLAAWLHGAVTPGVDHFFHQVGRLGNGGVWAGLGLVAYAAGLYLGSHTPDAQARLRWGGLARFGLLLLLTLATAGLLTWLLKNGIARARPELFFKMHIYGVNKPFSGHGFDSFPSSHSTAVFSLAAVIALCAPPWAGVLAFAMAVLVAVSRLVNLEHYLSDVLGSALLCIWAASVWGAFILDNRRGWPLRAPWRWGKPDTVAGARA